ncbi:MAG: hypothetical protein HS116_10165 [Planctomycetes bacterium]|nr:hypothetical protein [Planctomycetota bacterium]
MRAFLGKLGGRKFILAVFAALAVALHGLFGLDETSVMTLGGIVASYLLGQGFADGLSGGLTSTSEDIKEK